jgi:hypothetical protein
MLEIKAHLLEKDIPDYREPNHDFSIERVERASNRETVTIQTFTCNNIVVNLHSFRLEGPEDTKIDIFSGWDGQTQFLNFLPFSEELIHKTLIDTLKMGIDSHRIEAERRKKIVDEVLTKYGEFVTLKAL